MLCMPCLFIFGFNMRKRMMGINENDIKKEQIKKRMETYINSEQILNKYYRITKLQNKQ